MTTFTAPGPHLPAQLDPLHRSHSAAESLASGDSIEKLKQSFDRSEIREPNARIDHPPLLLVELHDRTRGSLDAAADLFATPFPSPSGTFLPPPSPPLHPQPSVDSLRLPESIPQHRILPNRTRYSKSQGFEKPGEMTTASITRAGTTLMGGLSGTHGVLIESGEKLLRSLPGLDSNLPEIKRRSAPHQCSLNLGTLKKPSRPVRHSDHALLKADFLLHHSLALKEHRLSSPLSSSAGMLKCQNQALRRDEHPSSWGQMSTGSVDQQEGLLQQRGTTPFQLVKVRDFGFDSNDPRHRGLAQEEAPTCHQSITSAGSVRPPPFVMEIDSPRPQTLFESSTSPVPPLEMDQDGRQEPDPLLEEQDRTDPPPALVEGGIHMAMYDFTAEGESEMDLVEGELVRVLEVICDGWVVAQKVQGQLVPSSFSSSSQSPSQSQSPSEDPEAVAAVGEGDGDGQFIEDLEYCGPTGLCPQNYLFKI